MATARRSASGAVHGEHGQGQPGPDAAGRLQQLEDRRSSSSAKPYRVSESSRTTSEVASWAGSPDPQRGQRAGRALHRQADAADLDDRPVGRERGDPAAHEGDHERVLSSA